MKVIVVESTHYTPGEREIIKRINDDVYVSVTDNQYITHTYVIGIFATADDAREFIKKEREKILTKYGEKALCDPCDEEEEELFEHYTFSTSMWNVKEGERPQDKWEYLKEHITEMRDADGELNQKDTCRFILELMGVIEREGESE